MNRKFVVYLLLTFMMSLLTANLGMVAFSFQWWAFIILWGANTLNAAMK